MLKKLLCLSLVLFYHLSWAAIHVEESRVIYDGSKKSATVDFSNQSETDYLVQSWLTDLYKKEDNLPIIVTPPIIKLAPKARASLRFIYSGEGLPKDRESLFWVNIQEVPPTVEGDNVLQIAVKTRIKLFYRPVAVKDVQLSEVAKGLTWQWQGDQLLIKNDQVLSVSLSKIYSGHQGDASSFDPGIQAIVLPKSTLTLKVPKEFGHPAQLYYDYVNDYGATSDRLAAKLR